MGKGTEAVVSLVQQEQEGGGQGGVHHLVRSRARVLPVPELHPTPSLFPLAAGNTRSWGLSPPRRSVAAHVSAPVVPTPLLHIPAVVRPFAHVPVVVPRVHLSGAAAQIQRGRIPWGGRLRRGRQTDRRGGPLELPVASRVRVRGSIARREVSAGRTHHRCEMTAGPRCPSQGPHSVRAG